MPKPDLQPASLVRDITGEAGRNKAAVIAVTRNGHTLTLSTGCTSLAQRTSTTENSAFEIGSVTKTFTALLLAVLAEEGTMRLDEPLAHHVPPGTMPRHPAAEHITALHLATHSSGLPHLFLGLILKALPAYTNPYSHYHERDLLKDLSRARLKCTPGTATYYSNMGFALLGRMMERITQKTYAQLVAEKIAGPLRLVNTTALSSGEQVEGYWHGRPMPSLLTPATAGAGSLRASAFDLTHYLRQHIRPSSRLPIPLRAALNAATHTPSPMSSTLAWHKRATADGVFFIHPGSTRSATAFIGFSTTNQTAVVSMASRGWTLRNSLIQNSYLLLRHCAGQNTLDPEEILTKGCPVNGGTVKRSV